MERDGENSLCVRQPAKIPEFHSDEKIMISNRFFYVSLAVAGCTAAAYAIGRRTRQIEKQQHKEELRNWEDEGGNLAPSEAPAIAPPAAAA
jgi:hypothetical protein